MVQLSHPYMTTGKTIACFGHWNLRRGDVWEQRVSAWFVPFPSHYHRNHECIFGNEVWVSEWLRWAKIPAELFWKSKVWYMELCTAQLLRFGGCFFLQCNLPNSDWDHHQKQFCFLEVNRAAYRILETELIEVIIFWFRVFFLAKLSFSI